MFYLHGTVAYHTYDCIIFGNHMYLSAIESSYVSLFILLGAAEMEEADIRRFINHAVRDDNAAVRSLHHSLILIYCDYSILQ